MRSAPSLGLAVIAMAALVGVAGAQATGGAPTGGEGAGGPLGFGGLGHSKEPITVVSDSLEYDYKRNVVVYRGNVEVTQGTLKLVSDTLTITLQNQNAKPTESAPDPPAATGTPATLGKAASDTGRVQEIVASGNVRIDQGTRWAVGGRAVFDQAQRTLVLTENPVLHDGPSEVAGDRVVVFLDEDRSVVEGGQKRVKAVFYPAEKNAAPRGAGKPGGKASGARRGRDG
jgi:lipopolysaccharide export system protein LptA